MAHVECPSCGRTISEDATSCKYCGEAVKGASTVAESTLSKEIVCPKCEHTIKVGVEVCPHCGYERQAPEKKAAPKTKKSSQEKEPPEVIVPRKKSTAKKEPAPKKKAPPPPAAKAKPKKEPETSTEEPRTRTPDPPTKIDQDRIDAAEHAPTTSEVPPPPGLDEDYLPDRPEGLPVKRIHVFLRGLQLAVKPMDYPTLVDNIRSLKIKLNDFIYDNKQKTWRSIADMFNLPEIE